METLPELTAIEQAHSDELADIIVQEIRAQGPMPFQRYMQMALYQPGFGYYVAGATKFGAPGDFVTAPEISPLFGQCLARQAIEVLHDLKNHASILEVGAGSGMLAATILIELAEQGQLPETYFILELGAELKQRQHQTLKDRVPDLVDKVVWIDTLEGFHLQGVVIANELLDAMPVCLFEQNPQGIFERTVNHNGSEFFWDLQTADETLKASVDQLELDSSALPYRSELNRQLHPWFATLAGVVTRGTVLLVDYGYEQSDYYHAQRNEGTLLCHFRQQALLDPLQNVGLMDITASVDFTAVAQAATDAGFEFSGYTNQASFLLGAGIHHIFDQVAGDEERRRLELSSQIKLLTLPSEMGERFKVIGFNQNYEPTLSGFDFIDLSHRL